jgi:phosphoribosylformylglycinamidine cyclo-ligase
MERVFNLGLGMLAVVPAGDAELAISTLEAEGKAAYKVGEVVEGDAVRLVSG